MQQPIKVHLNRRISTLAIDTGTGPLVFGDPNQQSEDPVILELVAEEGGASGTP